MAGLPGPCPHCGQQTELLLAPPPEEPSVSRRAVIWTVLTVVILGLGLVGALVALKRAQNWAARRHQAAAGNTPVTGPNRPPPGAQTAARRARTQNGFIVTAVTPQKTPGSSLVYAVGTLKNPEVR